MIIISSNFLFVFFILIFLFSDILSINTQFDLSSKTVFITGIAGFIGSNLAQNLALNGAKVIGIDIFNDYYSPELKYDRVQNLLKPYNISIIRGDVCNGTILHEALRSQPFTHIIHLAAQPGVRLSLKAPHLYIRQNIKCFVELLEVMKDINQVTRPRLIYASSSSIYGLNDKIPFSEDDKTDSASNIYGATKKMNELTAFAYHNLYGIKSIGLRFFTVYGPWGRPDMAAYLFTNLILHEKNLTLYNEGKMKRDFTYIDDIVQGISGALFLTNENPMIFNLGNNRPVEVLYVIKVLEFLLNKTAIINYSTSKAEIPTTFANITLAQQNLKYNPQISIDEGLKQTVQWYENYHIKKIYKSYKSVHNNNN